MAAYAALVSLLNNIEQIMKHPTLSTSLDNEHIQPLVEKAGFLLEFIVKNNYGGSSNKEGEDLERQITSVAHAAEDVIESHIVDQIHAGTNLGSTLDLQSIIEEMDAVMGKVAEIKEKRGGSREEEKATHSRVVAAHMETGESSTPPTRMVGLDDELNQLLDELTGNRYSSSLQVISIVGMGGMGKTTLAKNVYQNSYITNHFQFRAWATVSEQHNAQNILSQLLSSLGKSTSGSVDSLGGELHRTLSGRRYLIVLDDVWSVGAWDSVKRFFLDDGNKSRVVLTTRLLNVARVCLSSPFQMNFLDEGKSWELFCDKTLFPSKDDPLELGDVGKNIVRLCKGLALSIVVIGGLLQKSPRTVGFWEGVVQDLESNIPNSKEKQETLEALSLSYNHLPSHLKPCFLYFGVFKEDSEIRISKIIKLWVAEGFVNTEEIAVGYLKDLIDRNLILVGRLRKNGEIGSCGIHDLLRDLCLKVAEHQQLFHAIENHSWQIVLGTDRRLICDSFNCPDEGGPLLARSIMTKYRVGVPFKYRLLRVWVEGHCRPSKKEAESCGLVNLRYIAYTRLSYPPVWELPSSLYLLWNLQTLIVKNYSSYAMVVAPIEIWKMRQLRHVQYFRIYLPHPDPPSDGDQEVVLDNLQTLKVAVNLRLSEEVCKIIPNIKKLHLLYDRDMHGYDDSLIECLCNLDHLDKLESLKLEIKGSRWPTRDPEMNKKLRFPSSLNKLSLRQCQLHWNDLRMIGSLPLLQVLSLEILSVDVGERWSPIENQFQRLKFLKIDYCADLRYWDTDRSHFPVLEKLLLGELIHLKEIPLDIGNIPTLKLIRVDNCSESAAISAVKIKEDQLDNGEENGSLQIQVKICNSKLNSFKKRVETEGLTLDSFQLEIK